ncbi:MAG: hypothetical protein WC718_19115 [Phycisphaerales bacterium]
MTTYYAKTPGSLFAANAWNTLANGTGTDATFADGHAEGHVLDLNGKAMTAPNESSLWCDTFQGTTGTITPAGTLGIVAPVGGVYYNGTSTSGMVINGNGTAVAIIGGGPGTTAVTAAAAGYTIVTSGSGTYVVSNSGGTSLLNSSSGRAISSGTGTCDVTGAVSDTGTGYCLYHVTNAGIDTITGSVSATNTNPAIFVTIGTLNINGKITSSRLNIQASAVVTGSSCTLNWIGTHTYTVGEYCSIETAGAVNLGTGVAPNNLAITNAGAVICILSRLGTVATDYFTHHRTLASSQFSFVANEPFEDTGPTLPAAANVQSGAPQFGYAGDLQTAGYPTTAATNAAHQAADLAFLNANKDEMIAANDSIRAQYGCDAGTAVFGAPHWPAAAPLLIAGTSGGAP